jgi:hypothetical protein
MSWPSKDYRDYLDDGPKTVWHARKPAPMKFSLAIGAAGVLAGLTVGWCTSQREAPLALIGGFAGVLGLDFYWRYVRQSIPGRGRHQ